MNEMALRPTLILGLGGTGGRVALELKARLQDQFGEHYKPFIKFLYFDTATENLLTYQPNHPELPEVRLQPGSEFVRVSDVPLHDLMQSRADGSAISAILPEVLHSIQLDQGAQQVRRLGRIAFFYHYSRIKHRLEQTVGELRNARVNHPNSSFSFRMSSRPRVFLVCSICGGTGGGMFIDMAYLARRIVSGSSGSPREADIVGMLLLPEAFPEVRTTGEGRIRANAYASLLDLEFYNRPVLDSTPVQRVAYPTEVVPFESPPFSHCYLISGSSATRQLNGSGEIAPVLAETLHTMITTRIGEQLDATFDNVRTYTLNQYLKGYRTFYSVFGFSQLQYPRVWLQEQAAQRLQQELIQRAILAAPAKKPTQEEINAWHQVYLDQKTMYDRLRANMPELAAITERLSRLRRDVTLSADLTLDLQEAYDDARRRFQRQITNQVNINRETLGIELSNSLRQEVHKQVDQHGLRWTRAWLDLLHGELTERLSRRRRDPPLRAGDMVLIQHLNRIAQTENLPGAGRLAQRRTRSACSELIVYIQATLLDRLLAACAGDTLSDLIGVINEQRQAVDVCLAGCGKTPYPPHRRRSNRV